MAKKKTISKKKSKFNLETDSLDTINKFNATELYQTMKENLNENDNKIILSLSRRLAILERKVANLERH